ncbi:uncharacterized protein LOC144468154 isoform X1 [Augochlora pura]
MSTATSKLHSKRHKEEESEILKPFDFCCSPDSIDPLTKYDDKNKFLHKLPFASTNIINESPVLKFKTHFTGYSSSEQAKQSVKNKLTDIGDHRRRLHSGQDATVPYTSRNLQLQSRFGSSYINLQDKRAEILKWGPIKWYIEDEIGEAKDIFWERKRRIFNENMARNIKIGNERCKFKTLLHHYYGWYRQCIVYSFFHVFFSVNLSMDKELSKFPSWYQDFSIDQMKNIMMLQCVIRRDCEEMVSGRTERMLMDIGIVSTFFLLTPNIIKKLQKTSNCDAIKFLREIYKVLTGNYFEEEEYKHFYDCNERIILSAIAFLTLPETIMELHKRLPPVAEPKLPSKPLPPSLPIRQKKKSPYEDDLFTCPDWASYYNRIQIWRARYQLLPKPKLILPPKECILTEFTNVETSREYEENEGERKADRESLNDTRLYRTEQSPSSRIKRKRNSFTKREEKEEEEEGEERNRSTNKGKTSFSSVKEQHKGSITKKHSRDKKSTEQEVSTFKEVNKEETTFDIARLPNGSKVFDFTINGVSEKPGPVEYKICGVLQPPRPHNKSWLGEKHPHYIVSGAAENPPSCPITYEMTGVANVTPTNSDEKFFAVLKLGDGPKKIYPSGRKNLSPKWQEWLQNVDEEYRKIEREMQKLIKNIEAITRLVFPGPKCDNCCSCRQSRKSYIRGKEARTPYFVIDTIAEDSKKNKCIIGSMAMHSPAPTPPESTVNLLEVIASEDVLTTKLMINGVTNPKGETQYYISGITDEIIHQPSRIVERPPPAPPRNVPPCVCAIQQISAKGLTQEISHDHIPWTKEDGLCFGKKFRPHEAPAVSCKMYPGDKSCRRNPFYWQIVDMKRRVEESKRKSVDPFVEKRMYSIADFPPCGDEHGMSICGAPWGKLHTLTPEELEELEKLRKQILMGPPCGTKPGRAVCKGPFGERIPRKKPAIDLKEIPGEFDEEEEEEVEEEEARKQVKETKAAVMKEKERKRDQKCLTSPDILASKQKTKEEKTVKKFIPDPLYPGYDDTWNIHRTAPSEKESETDFKVLLKLSSPKPPATPAESKSMIDDREQFGSSLPKNTSKSRKDTEKMAVSRHAKSSETHSSATNQMNKIANKQKKKSNVTRDISEIYGKPLGSHAKSEGTVFDKSTKRDKTRNYKQPTESKVGRPRTKGNGKAIVSVKQFSKHSNLNLKTEKRSFHEKPGKKMDVKSKRKRDSESKFSKKNEKSDNENTSGTTKNKSNPNKSSPVRHEREKENKVFNLSKKKHKRKDSTNIENESIDPRKQILDVKKMLMSPDNYPPNVKPVDLPEELQTKCAHEYGHLDTEDDFTTAVEDTAVQLPSKGPCGWRTKSEQQLPTKKTLVYLCEPDYPPETIQVRTGGKPCVCRENRARKKVLMYNIGGLVRGKKDDTDHIDGKLLKKKKDEEDKKLQVIEGVIYHTPPLSPRRSDEYVPEYDLYKSPYDMCLSKRTDENLKYLERFGVPKISASKTFKQNEPCGCNESVDAYSIQTDGRDGKVESGIEELEKHRQELVKSKSPKERWELALKDTGLIDYYTRCRDSMPCWLKCRKFNRIGCGPPRAGLVVKRPVCECKYERKILENKEEKIKWKERREKLKSLKKQPFVNIENTSKPVVADTKLMISGVKRIPREDEYIDDIKYSITGVVENYTEEPPKPIVGGVHMATPIQTPEPSVEEIPCVCLHRHWSPVNIPPGPLPKPEELQRAEDYKRKMATEKAYRQIHVPDKVYDSHGTHSCDKTCNSSSVSEDEGVEEKSNGRMSKQRRRSNSTNGQISKDNTEKRSKLRSKSDKSEETMQNIKHSPKMPEQKEIRDLREKTEIRRVVEPTNSQNLPRTRSKLSKTTKTDSHLQHASSYSKEKLAEVAADKEDSEMSYDSHLTALIKNELSKLATEGFLFAKLPKCFLLPQLRYWLMYRKGIALSNADRDDSVRKSIAMWNSLDVGNVSRIEPPSIGMTKVQLRKLTFDDADRIKKQVCFFYGPD